MRWSIVGVIFRRELLDQFRDRRTLFMVVVLPLLLYPIGGIGLMQLAMGFLKKQYSVAVVHVEQLPTSLELTRQATAVLGLASSHPLLAPLGVDQMRRTLPPILGTASPRYELLVRDSLVLEDAQGLNLQPCDSPEAASEMLATRQVDLILEIGPGFLEGLLADQRPVLKIHGRPGDDRSRLAEARLTRVLIDYRETVKEWRLLRQGLPPDFDLAFTVSNPQREQAPARETADELFRAMAQIFPFVLVMWSLAGALYPAVDLCAGEKERGTMETLLISPASREEIVWGKFLTIWLFSAATALLNLLSMGLTTWYFSMQLPQSPFRPSIFLWGTLLLLPLSAFFSAVSLAIGVYARSSKEGQYYLMPLFFVTMPLIFLTLAPGVELNAFYSMVPVTGVALLLKALVIANTPSLQLVTYFIPVLVPMVIYSWLALRWAIEQFQREEVLFREAEQVDLVQWFRRLFREKEALPGQAMAFGGFFLVLIVFQVLIRLPLQAELSLHLLTAYLVGVLMPTLMMAIMLTTRPLLALALRPVTLRDLLLALALAVLLMPPGALTTHVILESIPGLKQSLQERLDNPIPGSTSPAGLFVWVQLTVLIPLLMAVSEELLFRGFILTGLSRYFSPMPALLLSSFLFAVFHMNVFQSIPHFLLGLVLGLLAQRTGSVIPAIVMHLAFNALVGVGLGVLPQHFPEVFAGLIQEHGWPTLLGWGIGLLGLLGALALLPLLLFRPVQIPPKVTA